MGNENVIKSHFIFHEPLIFNRSRKTHGFFMGHEFKNPHENPINSDTMKNSFSIHGFFIIIKQPWKNLVSFILFHGYMGFLSVRVFSWAMKRWILRGFSCFLHEISMPYSWYFPRKTHENSPLKSPERPLKNMWIYHEKFHWIFMGLNFIVLRGLSTIIVIKTDMAVLSSWTD